MPDEENLMREPKFRITNDDDPSDYAYPMLASLENFDGEPDVYADVQPLGVSESVTVGGGAGTQFTITRIR